MHGTLLAAVIHPDNTPHGYILTFAFPVALFVIVSAVLYLRFRSPHRVPGHVALSASRWVGTQPVSPHATHAAGAAGAASPAARTSTDAETQTVEADQAGSGEQGTEGGE